MALKTYLENGEIERLIEAAPTLRDKLIIRFLFRVGCRVSELVNIKASEVDFRRGLVLIHHLKSNPVKKECPQCKKKIGVRQSFCPRCGADARQAPAPEGSERMRLVRVDHRTLELTQEYLQKRLTKSDKLFSLTRQMIYYIIREATEKAGLGGKILLNPDTGKHHYISPHRLRDAHALRWLKAIRQRGDDPGRLKELQEHLGHKSFETTTRYWKLAPGEGGLYGEIWEES